MYALYHFVIMSSFCCREKDIDIAFAQEAIDEYKVKTPERCVLVFFVLSFSAVRLLDLESGLLCI